MLDWHCHCVAVKRSGTAKDLERSSHMQHAHKTRAAGMMACVCVQLPDSKWTALVREELRGSGWSIGNHYSRLPEQVFQDIIPSSLLFLHQSEVAVWNRVYRLCGLCFYSQLLLTLQECTVCWSSSSWFIIIKLNLIYILFSCFLSSTINTRYDILYMSTGSGVCKSVAEEIDPKKSK